MPRPPDERCVWMTAGVISYRLCPNERDCASCALDRELSGRRDPARRPAAAQAYGEERLVAVSAGMEALLGIPPRWREGRSYHTSHLWGRMMSRGRIRLGLDDVANRLLGEDVTWSLPVPGTTVSRGDPLAHASTGDTILTLPSPLPGRVCARNDALIRHPALALWAPYDTGWLVELRGEAPLSPTTGFLADADVIRRWLEAGVVQLEACCRGLAPAEDARLGPTLNDGGTALGSLRAALGRDGFRRAAHLLLSATVRPARAS